MDEFIPESSLPRIVIIGAGFGGLEVAKKLDRNKFQILLIGTCNYHTFQPLLYQVATGGLEPDSIAYPIRKIFSKKSTVLFRTATCNGVNPGGNTISTTIGDIGFHKLVIATGSTSNFFGLKGISENSLTLKSVTDALDFRSCVLQNFELALI